MSSTCQSLRGNNPVGSADKACKADLPKMSPFLVQTTKQIPQPEVEQHCSHLLPLPIPSFLDYYFHIKLSLFVKSFSSTPTKCIVTHIPSISSTEEKRRQGEDRSWAWGGTEGGVQHSSETPRGQPRGSAGKCTSSSALKGRQRPSSCTGLDGRSSLGPDKKEFCSLSINLQLSLCEGCSPRCLGQVVDFSCCPVTWLEAEDDPSHLAP